MNPIDLHSVQVVPHPDDVASENARNGVVPLPSPGGGGGNYGRNTASSPFPGARSGGPTPQSASGYFNSDFENENLSPCNMADFPDPDGGGSVGSELRAARRLTATNPPMSHPSAFRPPPPVPALQTATQQQQHRYVSTYQHHHQQQSDYMGGSIPDHHHQQQFAANHNVPPTNHSLSHNESYDNLSMPDTFWEAPVGVEHVNWLMSYCQIVRREEPITSLRQCTSSLFVLVFQRIFDCNIENLELDPNTHEKRLHNIQRVMEELEVNILSASGDHVSLSHISAEQIVLVNEDHIAMLVQVFLDIAQAVMRHSQMADRTGTNSAAPNSKTGGLGLAGGAGGPAGAGGGGDVPPLRQQLLEDIASEVSAADSADKTQLLVSKWQRELVHPEDVRRPPTSHGSKFNKPALPTLNEEVLNLRRRMLHFDEMLISPNKGGGSRSLAAPDASRISTPHHGKCTSIDSRSSTDFPATAVRRVHHADPSSNGGMGAFGTVRKIQGGTIPRAPTGRSNGRGISSSTRVRSSSRTRPSRQVVVSSGPYVPASTYATFPADTYHMVRTLDTEARDHKIEQLRTMKFIQDTCAVVRSDVVKQASEKQAAIAIGNKEYAKRRARDVNDIKKLVKDEDDRYKLAYQCIMTSARNDIERYGDVVDRHSRHVFKRNKIAIQEAEMLAQEAKDRQEDYIGSKSRKYSRVVSGWRSGTVSAA